jgi:acetyl esterase
MPLDPLAKRLLAVMAARFPGERRRSTVSERRQALASLMQFARAEIADVTAQSGALPGPGGEVAYRLYVPAAAQGRETAPGFVFFHGGGMVAGSIDTHDQVAAALAQATGCRLISVEYRLAPENKFPAAVEDAIAATEFVLANAGSLGIDRQRIVVGGDAAGATLAAVVCQYALHNAWPSVAAQCLICPVLDFEQTSPSREEFAEGPLIDRATLEADLSDYLPEGGADVADPRISPLRAINVAGLAPAIIHTAEYDPMRDEGSAYARKLLAAGVSVEHVCHDGMIHNFHAMGAVLPQAQLVLSQIGEQVRRALGG